MLHLYYGTDTIKARTKALAVAGEVGTTIERIEAETFVPQSLHNVAEAVSLFGDVTTYIIDSPSLSTELWSELVAVAEALQQSPQLFVIVDGPLSVNQLKSLQPFLDQTALHTKDKAMVFNIFSLADALAQRDKKTLWMLLVEATRAGYSAEEIIGTFWWQLKSLRLAALTASASEAGMKEYPYNKAKRSLRNFKGGEISLLSSQLLTVYHEGHGGEKDIWIGLEEWVLGV